MVKVHDRHISLGMLKFQVSWGGGGGGVCLLYLVFILWVGGNL